MKKHYDDLWSGILFLAIAAAVTTQLSSIKIANIAMTSRMVPDICVILLYAFGIVQVVRWLVYRLKNREAFATKENAEPKDEKTKGVLRALLCAALIAVFILLLNPVGFIPAGIIYLFCTFLVLVPQGYKNRVVYIVSILFPIAVYFIFTKAFSIILPKGTIW